MLNIHCLEQSFERNFGYVDIFIIKYLVQPDKDILPALSPHLISAEIHCGDKIRNFPTCD